MTKNNHGRVGEALELLNRGLRPFVERELQAVYGYEWEEIVGKGLYKSRGAMKGAQNSEINWDTYNLLTVMWNQWNTVFCNILGRSERSLVSELRDVRNRWAHQEQFSIDDAYRALDSMERLLTAISAPEAKGLEEQKMALLRARFDEQRQGDIDYHVKHSDDSNFGPVTAPTPTPVPTSRRKPTKITKQAPVPQQHKAQTIDLGAGVTLEMVFIPGGSFQMGSPDREFGRRDDEGPIHKVELNGFWIGKYQVTQAQYRAIMGTNPSRFKGDDRPVEMVSWDSAMEFCEELSQKTGKRFTLPTEAQWEYACRAGTRTRYCFGDDSGLLNKHAWYYTNSHDKTHPVGQKKPNAWGLYDMHGNVWEWCRDWYGSDYYQNSSSSNPKGTSSISNRVRRGGCAYDPPDYCRSANRSWETPGNQNPFLGFRLVALQSMWSERRP